MLSNQMSLSVLLVAELASLISADLLLASAIAGGPGRDLGPRRGFRSKAGEAYEHGG
jgi:hypothetical protein